MIKMEKNIYDASDITERQINQWNQPVESGEVYPFLG